MEKYARQRTIRAIFQINKNSRKVIIKIISVEFNLEDSGKAIKEVYELYFKTLRLWG